MPEIEVDFEVWKALTAKRNSETHSYNSVLREMLNLGDSLSSLFEARHGGAMIPVRPVGGFAIRDLFLPNGTQLRASHKGQAHTAQIVRGFWVNANGREFSSPSSAASAITGNNVNGLRFWEAKRPNDMEWRKLDSFPKATL